MPVATIMVRSHKPRKKKIAMLVVQKKKKKRNTDETPGMTCSVIGDLELRGSTDDVAIVESPGGPSPMRVMEAVYGHGHGISHKFKPKKNVP